MRLRSFICLLLLLGFCSVSASAQEAAKFFDDNCTTCHTIGGGKVVGPDLKGVTNRKDRAWLERFMQDPEAVLNSGDAYALKLKKDSDDMVMPALGVTPQMAKALLEMIEEKSGQPASAPAAAAKPAAPAGASKPAAAAAGAPPTSASKQQAADFFQKSCKACHTIGGGRLVGPDLKDVTKRKDRVWLEKFLQNPKAMLDSGDPYALQLQQDSHGIVMPTVSGVTPSMATLLLDMIEEKSGLAAAGGGETGISERPFTEADIALGMALFRGERRFSHEGPACISCHTLGTLDGMGGGRLGPDLTMVYERLGGRKAIGAWMSAPATPTMQAVFKQHPLDPDKEILPLLAVFDNAARYSQPADSGSQVNFLLAGSAGLCVSLTVMGWVWRERLRSVRQNLVSIARGEEE